jgi:hypothetical protein
VTYELKRASRRGHWRTGAGAPRSCTAAGETDGWSSGAQGALPPRSLLMPIRRDDDMGIVMKRRRYEKVMMCVAVLATGLGIGACGSSASAPKKSREVGSAYAPKTWGESASTATGSGGQSATDMITYTVTVSKLAGTSRQLADLTVRYECGGGGASCVWSSEASQIAGNVCPLEFDSAQSVWAGPLKHAPGTEHATFTFEPRVGVPRPQVCVYVDDAS